MPKPDTKGKILDAAQDSIQRVGANAMSYQDISEAVGIQKASIHYHFPTKEKLIEALIERYSERFFSLVQSIVDSELSPETKLRRYGLLFETMLSEGERGKVCLCGILGAELGTLGPVAADNIRRFFKENEKRLAEILDEGREQNVFKFEGDSRSMAILVFCLLEGAMLVVRADEGTQRYSAIMRQMIRLVSP